MKPFNNKTCVLFLFFAYSSFAFAILPEQIIESKKRAVLVITIYDKKNLKPWGVGSGFFTDGKGHFVTNYHIVEEFLSKPKDYLIQIQNQKGDEFGNVEIEKCENSNKIDLCYGSITTDKKNYYFDVLNRSPVKGQEVAIVGHNGDYFSVKKGKVAKIEVNVEEKFGVPISEQQNRNTSMIQLSDYDYKSGSCKGDSGSPVFDHYTGDLLGVFANCIGKKGDPRNKYAIDSKEVYSFINSDSKFIKVKILNDQIYTKPKPLKNQEDVTPARGDEFETERETGKLE